MRTAGTSVGLRSRAAGPGRSRRGVRSTSPLLGGAAPASMGIGPIDHVRDPGEPEPAPPDNGSPDRRERAPSWPALSRGCTRGHCRTEDPGPAGTADRTGLGRSAAGPDRELPTASAGVSKGVSSEPPLPARGLEPSRAVVRIPPAVGIKRTAPGPAPLTQESPRSHWCPGSPDHWGERVGAGSRAIDVPRSAESQHRRPSSGLLEGDPIPALGSQPVGRWGERPTAGR